MLPGGLYLIAELLARPEQRIAGEPLHDACLSLLELSFIDWSLLA